MQNFMQTTNRRLPEPQATIDESKKYSCHFEYEDLVQRLLQAKQQIELQEHLEKYSINSNYISIPQLQQPKPTMKKMMVPQLDLAKIESEYTSNMLRQRVQNLQQATERNANKISQQYYPSGAVTYRDQLQQESKDIRKFNLHNIQMSNSTKNQNTKRISYNFRPNQKTLKKQTSKNTLKLNKIQTENYVQSPYQQTKIQLNNKTKQTYLNRVMKRTQSQTRQLFKNNTQQQLAPLDKKPSLETIKQEVTYDIFKNSNLAQTLTLDSQQNTNLFNQASFKVKTPIKYHIMDSKTARNKKLI